MANWVTRDASFLNNIFSHCYQWLLLDHFTEWLPLVGDSSQKTDFSYWAIGSALWNYTEGNKETKTHSRDDFLAFEIHSYFYCCFYTAMVPSGSTSACCWPHHLHHGLRVEKHLSCFANAFKGNSLNVTASRVWKSAVLISSRSGEKTGRECWSRGIIRTSGRSSTIAGWVCYLLQSSTKPRVLPSAFLLGTSPESSSTLAATDRLPSFPLSWCSYRLGLLPKFSERNRCHGLGEQHRPSLDNLSTILQAGYSPQTWNAWSNGRYVMHRDQRGHINTRSTSREHCSCIFLTRSTNHAGRTSAPCARSLPSKDRGLLSPLEEE